MRKLKKLNNIAKEQQFFGGLIKRFEVFKRIYRDIPVGFFSSKNLTRLFREMIENYENSFSRMNSDSLAERLERKESSDAEIRKYRTLWRKCRYKAKDITEAKIFELYETLRNFYRLRKITEGQVQVLSLVEEGNSEDALAALHKSSIELSDSGDRITQVAFLDSYEILRKEIRMMEKHPDKFKGVPTGFSYFDRHMGGLRKSELGIILGGTGKGKSIMLMNFAYNAWMKDYNVLFFTIEMKKEQINRRIWCKATGINYDKFRNATLTKEEKIQWRKKYRFLKKKKKALFEIVDVPEGCTCKVVKGIIREHQRKMQIDLVCIDYLNIMATGQGTLGYDWEGQLIISAELHALSRFFDVPIWSPVQVAAVSQDKEILGIPDLGYSKGIPQNIDLGVWLGQSPDMEDVNRINVGFLKTRDIGMIPLACVSTEFQKMSFTGLSRTKKMKMKKRRRERRSLDF